MARHIRRSDRPIPAHPYRDAALIYGVMAVVLVVIASLTGGDVLRAALVAVVFFLVATGWTSWRFRERIKDRDARAAAAGPGESSEDHANGGGRGGAGG